MSSHKDKKSWAWNGEIGPFLEEARERRGLSLKEAEQSTRIRWRYLEGLEREDPRELPDKGYVQGFLSAYAEFLGLDVEEISNRFKRHAGERKQRRQHRGNPEEDVAATSSASGQDDSHPGNPGFDRRSLRSGALLTLSLAVLVLALVVAAFYILRGDSLLSNSPVSGGEVPAENAPGEAGPDEAPRVGGEQPAPTLEEGSEAGEPGRGESLQTTVLVRGSESWISVESESGVEYTGIAQPGFSQSFESGQSLRITTGNAGAVELRINGIEYGPLGENGEVTSRNFTLKRER